MVPLTNAPGNQVEIQEQVIRVSLTQPSNTAILYYSTCMLYSWYTDHYCCICCVVCSDAPILPSTTSPKLSALIC